MAYTYDTLKTKTLADLRELARTLPHDAIQGYTQMNKEHLLPEICKALGIDTFEHHAAALAQKGGIRAQMEAIKSQRAGALAAGDHDLLHSLRRKYHALNHKLRTSAKRPISH